MRDDTSLPSEVLEKIPNKYLAVVVSSKRARVLNDGARPLVKSSASKPTTVALEEIAAGAVVPDAGKPKLKAAEEVEELPPPPEESPDTEAEPETPDESKAEAEDEDKDDSEDEIEPESEEEGG
jgi:DNA-directed RNA polymerase subunit omega